MTKQGNAVVLVHFHSGDREAKVRKLRNADQMAGWPGGKVLSAHGLKARVYGDNEFHAIADLQVRDRGQLRRVCEFIEQHFSHVDGFEW